MRLIELPSRSKPLGRQHGLCSWCGPSRADGPPITYLSTSRIQSWPLNFADHRMSPYQGWRVFMSAIRNNRINYNSVIEVFSSAVSLFK